jgi:hypothetical protein
MGEEALAKGFFTFFLCSILRAGFCKAAAFSLQYKGKNKYLQDKQMKKQ